MAQIYTQHIGPFTLEPNYAAMVDFHQVIQHYYLA